MTHGTLAAQRPRAPDGVDMHQTSLQGQRLLPTLGSGHPAVCSQDAMELSVGSKLPRFVLLWKVTSLVSLLGFCSGASPGSEFKTPNQSTPLPTDRHPIPCPPDALICLFHYWFETQPCQKAGACLPAQQVLRTQEEATPRGLDSPAAAAPFIPSRAGSALPCKSGSKPKALVLVGETHSGPKK